MLLSLFRFNPLANPTQSNPIQSNPIQSNPIQPNPIQSSIQSSIQSNPIQSNPIQPNPTQSNHQSNPIQSNPIQSNPTQPNPIQSNPIQSNPIINPTQAGHGYKHQIQGRVKVWHEGAVAKWSNALASGASPSGSRVRSPSASIFFCFPPSASTALVNTSSATSTTPLPRWRSSTLPLLPL